MAKKDGFTLGSFISNISSVGEVVRYVTLFRTLWLGGRYGGGKTSFSVLLALNLIDGNHARFIASNFPLNCGLVAELATEDDVVTMTDVVTIIDEAWGELGQGTNIKRQEKWLAYLRKNNQYVLLPSVLPLVRQVSAFAVERMFNFVPIGGPWVYRWRLNATGITSSQNEHGVFALWHPHKLFGLYDHEYKPSGKFYVYDFGDSRNQ